MLSRKDAEKILLAIPGARPGEHFRKPAIFMGENFLTRIHHKEDAVVILTGSIEMRDVMLEAEPRLFYIIDHYRNFPALLARLSALDKKTLLSLLARRIKQIEDAPKPKKTAKTRATKKSPAKKKTRKA